MACSPTNEQQFFVLSSRALRISLNMERIYILLVMIVRTTYSSTHAPL